MGTIFKPIVPASLREAGAILLFSLFSGGSRTSRKRAGLWQHLIRCQRRYQERRHLAALDARLLADMGITRADAMEEARKPIWRP